MLAPSQPRLIQARMVVRLRVPRQPIRALRDVRLGHLGRDIAQRLPDLAARLLANLFFDCEVCLPYDSHQREEDKVEHLRFSDASGAPGRRKGALGSGLDGSAYQEPDEQLAHDSLVELAPRQRSGPLVQPPDDVRQQVGEQGRDTGRDDTPE